ncbi:39S ribosomal protein L9, mitochondrial [Aplysia californica]|uniref:Large ribosomal subunit protein bL9m n=1 Tax=Aplysia californica TaxID=6500 RepID=A0ABM0JWI4_APLCA|nr:39S ribosomal protein L9, mitochondrial [Aplysia californica]
MAVAVKLLRGCCHCGSLSRTSLAAKELLSRTAVGSVVLQTRNNTRIMERVYPLPVGKDGGRPDRSQMNELYKILREVEIVKYPEEIQCILTDFVEGVGIRGDVVTVKRDFFHEELFPAGMAVYASPDNIEEFEEERKAKGIDKAETRLGVFARMTMKELSNMHLEIPLSDSSDWTLCKRHVQVAFRIQGVEVEEDCLELPEEAVTEFQDVTINVWINGLESVPVSATIVPISEKFPPTKK